MTGDEIGTDSTTEAARPVEEKKPNWFMRARIPLWVALPLFVVGILFAFFISYPQRSVSSAVERMFRNTDNVEITYCLSNEAAREADRWKAEERFKEELRSLGVKNVNVRFESPCPQAGVSTPGVPQHTPAAPAPSPAA